MNQLPRPGIPSLRSQPALDIERIVAVGHSAGGVFTQLLLDHGYGAAGVAINSAPTEGILVNPPSQLKSLFPILKNPAKRHSAVGFTHEQWHYAFTNGFSEEESRAAYERYHVPASVAIFWENLLANVNAGRGATFAYTGEPGTQGPVNQLMTMNGNFTADSLEIAFELNGAPQRWQPGMRDPANLRGTRRTLAGEREVVRHRRLVRHLAAGVLDPPARRPARSNRR